MPESKPTLRALSSVGSARRLREGAAPRPTIKAVAEQANVAISTVSRVVNGGPASELVRQRVLAAIDDLGYTPSVAARSLVNRRAGSIGLAVNSSQSPWFSQILAGIEEALAPTQMSVLLASMMLSGKYDAGAVVSWLQEGRVDGLIIVRYSRRDRPLLQAASQAQVPVVLIAPDLSVPSEFIVRSKNAQGGRLVAEHLIALGHTSIAFAGGPRESIDARERLRGLTTALVEKDPDNKLVDVWFGPSYSPAAGIEYAQRFLSLPPTKRPTAVVLGNDPMALAFMRSLLQNGLQIPEDVSVAGFDGTPDGGQFWPGLTTVVQPTRQMAARACRSLLAALQQNESYERLPSLDYDVELLVRESTAPPP